MTKRTDAKGKALAEFGALNRRPQNVAHPQFQFNEFFDPHDLVQVKYEMLRLVRVDGQTVTDAAAAFGFSRPAFYQARAAFERYGLPGLVPKRPGPRHAHKLSEVVMQFVDQQRAKDPTLRTPVLANMICKRLGLSVHPRSIERALSRRTKKGR
jgi:transposase